MASGTASPPKPPAWSVYRRLLGFARPYAGRLALGVLFGAMTGGGLLGLLTWLRRAVAAVFSPADLPLSAAVAVLAGLPAFALVRGLGDFLSTYFISWVGHRVVMDLRSGLFAHVHDLSLDFFTKTRTGELMSRTLNDTMAVERAVSAVVGDLAKCPFEAAAAVVALVWLDWKLALIGLALFPVAVLPMAFFGRRVRRFSREGQEKLADLMSVMQESVSGVRIVKAFAMEGYETRRFADLCKTVFSRAMRVTRARASVEPIIVFISFVGLAGVFVYVRWTHMTFDTFLTFAAALVAMYEPVKKLSRIHVAVQQSSASAERVFDLLDAPVTVTERPGARPFAGPLREIAFDDVSFSYGEGEVLRNIRLSVKAGSFVALVGSSGSGKTTLVSLLPRFYDVTGGSIRFNGIDIRDLSIPSLRALVGVVTQEHFLFNDTVASNIAYGQGDAPREAVVAAAKRALAHDFIEALPQGYDTVIGERGVRLSGGQCQRLAIARAILRNPPVLILDEATSALDTESERQVQAALEELMAGRTVFAIAHRLSTVIHADRILVLDGGRVAEEGAHRDLLARGGLYRYFYDLQFRDRAGAGAEEAGGEA
jgi:subfamily B ATP-binding cassette protein MsbA